MSVLCWRRERDREWEIERDGERKRDRKDVYKRVRHKNDLKNVKTQYGLIKGNT